MNKDTIDKLKKIGFAKNEAKIYLTLLEKGELKVGEIVELSDIKTGKIYDTLNLMHNKGLVSSYLNNNIKTYVASPPNKIEELITKKEKEILEIKKESANLIPLLKKINTNKEDHFVKMYKGDKGLKSLLEEITPNIKDGEKIYNLGISKEKRDFFIINLWLNFSKRLIEEKNVKFLFILSESKSQIKKELSNLKHASIKYLDIFNLAPITIAGDFIILNDYLFMLHIIIKNKNIAKTFRDMAKNLWKIAKS